MASRHFSNRRRRRRRRCHRRCRCRRRCRRRRRRRCCRRRCRATENASRLKIKDRGKRGKDVKAHLQDDENATFSR